MGNITKSYRYSRFPVRNQQKHTKKFWTILHSFLGSPPVRSAILLDNIALLPVGGYCRWVQYCRSECNKKCYYQVSTKFSYLSFKKKTSLYNKVSSLLLNIYTTNSKMNDNFTRLKIFLTLVYFLYAMIISPFTIHQSSPRTIKYFIWFFTMYGLLYKIFNRFILLTNE